MTPPDDGIKDWLGEGVPFNQEEMEEMERPASPLNVPEAPAENETPEPDGEMCTRLLDATNNSDTFVMQEMGRSLDQLVQSEEEADEYYRRLVLQHDHSSSPLVMDTAMASPRTVLNEMPSVDSDILARELDHMSQGSDLTTPSSLGFSVSATDSELKRMVGDNSLRNSLEILIASIEREDTSNIAVDQGVQLNTSNFFVDSGMSTREEVDCLEAEVAKLASSLVLEGDLDELGNMEPPLATSNTEVNKLTLQCI